MRHLDEKYKKILLEKKYLYASFQNHMMDVYRENSRVRVRTLYGATTINDNPNTNGNSAKKM